MNTAWAIAELDKFISQTVMRNGSHSSGGVSVITPRNYTAAPDAEVTKQAQVVEKILDRVIPKWRTEIDNSKNNRWTRHREAAIRAREQLAREQEIKENLGENAPELSAAQLHPWVWSGARSLWQSGHYREAVEGAIKKPLYVPEGTGVDSRRDVLQRWQREQLRRRIPGLIAQWEETIGRQVPRWSIRHMKTKWGSCNRETGHIWFNIELAKKHPDCLEYIAVHEMTHLLERNHGERFTTLMDGFLPDWRSRRDQLNEAPLGHEEWPERG